MKASAVVKTEVEVDLTDFHTEDLINELEQRGHAVDADCAAELNTEDLVNELSHRHYTEQFAHVPLATLINALKHFGCPRELIQQLLEWDSQPVATKSKLEVWKELCHS